VSVLAIVLLLISSLAIVASDTILLGQAKKSSTTTKAGNAGVGGGFVEEPPMGTEPLTPATANNSAAAIAIAHRLAITSGNSSKTNGGPCLPQLNHFVLPLKEARFTVINNVLR